MFRGVGKQASLFAAMETPPKEISDALARMHLLEGAAPTGEPLTGGVSSEIWRIDFPGGPICIPANPPQGGHPFMPGVPN